MSSQNNSMLNQHHPNKHVRSFYYAGRGLSHIIKNEANFRIHVLAAILVVGLAAYLKFNYIEWVVLSFTIGFVFITEILNTLIEELIDHLVKEHHESARIIKDLGAAAVLTAAGLSLVVAGLLFVPKLLA